jgi:hypothetical protein
MHDIKRDECDGLQGKSAIDTVNGEAFDDNAVVYK